jgi:hypothetical protein
MVLSLAKYYPNLIEKETRQSFEKVRKREWARGIKRSDKRVQGKRSKGRN